MSLCFMCQPPFTLHPAETPDIMVAMTVERYFCHFGSDRPTVHMDNEVVAERSERR